MKMRSLLPFTLLAGCYGFSLRASWSLESVKESAENVKAGNSQLPGGVTFGTVDANNDGKIDPREFQVVSGPMPFPAPAPFPGASPAPSPFPGPAPAPAGISFAHVDRNSDGKISFVEFRLFILASTYLNRDAPMPREVDMQKQFRSLDRNLNNFIEPDEFNLYLLGIVFPAPAPAPAPFLVAAASPYGAVAPAPAPGPLLPCTTTTVPCGHPMRPTKSPRHREHDLLQNVAHQIAGGTSRSLFAVTRAGQKPSPLADAAQTHAYAAMANAKRGIDLVPETEKETRQASQMITTLGRVMKKGMTSYSEQITKVQIPPPLIPAMLEPPKGLDLTRT